MPVIYTLTDENNSCDICEHLTVPRQSAIDDEDDGKMAATVPGGGTQYKSGYRDVPQTWVAKSGRQVHQWVPFFSKHGILMGLFYKIF